MFEVMSAMESSSTQPRVEPKIEGLICPTGVNHLAISATDMKVQLTYWA
jgi:hypothetical protein